MTPNIMITKYELLELYINQQQTKDYIASQYGFKSRTPITRLLKKYDIKERNRTEARNIQILNDDINIKIPKDILEEELLQMSILKIAKKHGITKSALYRWMDEYDLTSNYYKSKHLWDGELDTECNSILSNKELAIKYDVDIGIVKKYRTRDLLPEIYSIEKIKELVDLYDIHGQGFIKQMKLDDMKLLESVEFYTKDHILNSGKLTERIYRIINGIKSYETFWCSNCKSSELKFYTMALGYGNSDYKLCMSCNNVLNGVSKLSQKLFWKIYEAMDVKSDCFFHELNHEVSIQIDKEFASSHEKSNRRYYLIDFSMNNKLIEFDGRYYHTDEEREHTKDIFLTSKGYDILHISDVDYIKFPTETIEKCINFLIQ